MSSVSRQHLCDLQRPISQKKTVPRMGERRSFSVSLKDMAGNDVITASARSASMFCPSLSTSVANVIV